MAGRARDFAFGIMIGFILSHIFLYASDFGNIFQIINEKFAVTDKATNNPTQKPEELDTKNCRNSSLQGDDDTIAQEMSKKVRVLVWVMTSPQNLQTKAKAVKETWGKRCNIILYMSSTNNETFPAIGLGVPEGREYLTAKTMAAFRYIYENYFDEADWFMKVDDDAYVIVENLRYFLSNKDTQKPVFYGHLFKILVNQGYYSGGSGYVISKEALSRFGTMPKNSTLCRKNGGDEDVEFSKCMEKLGVKTSPSRDDDGRILFHPDQFKLHLLGTLREWYFNYTSLDPKKPLGLSKYPVSFHYVGPEDMRLLDLYLYYIHPYGIHSTFTHCTTP